MLYEEENVPVDYGLDMHTLLLREKGVPTMNYNYDHADVKNVTTEAIRDEY